MVEKMDLEKLIQDYEYYHQDPFNIKIHLICVPLIMLSVLGFLNSVPIALGNLGLGHLVAGLFLIYYLLFARPYFVPLVALFVLVIAADMLLSQMRFTYYLGLNIAIFVICWIFQFWGHRHEGNNPAFIDNKETGIYSTFMAPILVVRHARELFT